MVELCDTKVLCRLVLADIIAACPTLAQQALARSVVGGPNVKFKFANGKELGTVGLQWLKVHLSNLFGYDKASLKDREQFAVDHIDDIYDSATNPLNGKRWWTKAEDPWQCLACCMELKSALDSPDPTRFVSHLPVHQDGTCNGLPHYAALGGDIRGAQQVSWKRAGRMSLNCST